MFSEDPKMPFLEAFRWFLDHNSPKCRQILSKFETLMQIVILHHVYYGFWYSPKNSKKISPKTHFLGFFRRFLGHTLARPNVSTKIFCLMEGPMEIHNRAKFHLHSICGCQVICLQSFSYQQSGAFWAAFGWFFMYYDPKSSPICTKFWPEMQCRENITYVTGFAILFKILWNWRKKPYFLGFAMEVFRPRPLTPSVSRINLLSNERSHGDRKLCQVSSW